MSSKGTNYGTYNDGNEKVHYIEINKSNWADQSRRTDILSVNVMSEASKELGNAQVIIVKGGKDFVRGMGQMVSLSRWSI